MAQSPVIMLENVCKAFDNRPVLEDISLEIAPGEILAVIGPSGCGKSTLLRIIAGLDQADIGTVERAEENLTLVFQYSALFDSLTVFENVAFSLLESPDKQILQANRPKYSDSELRDLVAQKLQLVGLGEIMDLYPNQLSGGMQKRVSFARAIMSDPRVILYDEPTAGLDPIASSVIENYIRTLRDETGATSVVVTHNLSTIRHVADRVCLLFDGRVQWMGSPDAFFVTENPYARQFAHGDLHGPMTRES